MQELGGPGGVKSISSGRASDHRGLEPARRGGIGQRWAAGTGLQGGLSGPSTVDPPFFPL